MNADPKELKRQKAREWYAQHKDEILARKRQTREQKKADGCLNGQDILSHGNHSTEEAHVVLSSSKRTPFQDISNNQKKDNYRRILPSAR